MYLTVQIEIGSVLRPEEQLIEEQTVLSVESEIALMLQTKYTFAHVEVVEHELSAADIHVDVEELIQLAPGGVW